MNLSLVTIPLQSKNLKFWDNLNQNLTLISFSARKVILTFHHRQYQSFDFHYEIPGLYLVFLTDNRNFGFGLWFKNRVYVRFLNFPVISVQLSSNYIDS